MFGCYPLGEKLLWNRCIGRCSSSCWCFQHTRITLTEWCIPHEEKVLAEFLHDVGYINHVVGKWVSIVYVQGIAMLNTSRSRQDGRHFQTTFWNGLSWMKLYWFRLKLKFYSMLYNRCNYFTILGFIPHLTGHVIIYPCLNQSWSMLV